MSELSPLIAETLSCGGEVILTITGTSMLPLLRHRRDQVYLTRLPEQGLQKYDIPLFVRADGRHILHRIIAVTSQGYALAGDNQCTIEYPVQHHQVLGVVKGFSRNGKYVACDNLCYRLYSRLWVACLPLRRAWRRGRQLLVHWRSW